MVSRKQFIVTSVAAALSAAAQQHGSDSRAVSVADFGATGAGGTDDTAAIQAAMDAVGEGGRVIIPAGVYTVDVDTGLSLRSGIHLDLASNARLRALPSKAGKYALLRLWGIQDASVTGGVIQGERAGHTGSRGEWGMGIDIRGSQRLLVRDVVVEEFWGDGIYVAADSRRESRGVTLLRCRCVNNRRQGISLVGCTDSDLLGCTAIGTHGTAPAAGLDLEPNEPFEVARIRVVGGTFIGNDGAGITMSGEAKEVTIVGVVMNQNGQAGLRIADSSAVTVVDCVASSNHRSGVEIETVIGDSVVEDVVVVGSEFSNNGEYGLRTRKRGTRRPATPVLADNRADGNVRGPILLER